MSFNVRIQQGCTLVVTIEENWEQKRKRNRKQKLL